MARFFVYLVKSVIIYDIIFLGDKMFNIEEELKKLPTKPRGICNER